MPDTGTGICVESAAFDWPTTTHSEAQTSIIATARELSRRSGQRRATDGYVTSITRRYLQEVKNSLAQAGVWQLAIQATCYGLYVVVDDSTWV